MSDAEHRYPRRENHPPERTHVSRVEDVRELESGIRKVRLDTGEVFVVNPIGNADLPLPNVGDEIRLYLNESRRHVVGVDINGVSVYYEPPTVTHTPSRQDLVVFNDLWNGGSPSSPHTTSSGSMRVPFDVSAVERTQRREDYHLAGRLALARALSGDNTAFLSRTIDVEPTNAASTPDEASGGCDSRSEHEVDPRDDWERALSYLNDTNPGWREMYRREFGREPDSEGVARLIARETGALD